MPNLEFYGNRSFFAEVIIKAICLLHNIIIDREGLDENLREEVEKQNTKEPQNEFNKTSIKNGRLIRDHFCNYLCLNKLK